MTTEEKATKYDEALDWMRELYPGLHGATKEDAEHYFPELKESEDERIRKELIGLISCMHDADPRKKGWLDWLEKQKENPKSADSISSDCTSDAKCEDQHNEEGDFVFELRQIISSHRYSDIYGEYTNDEEGMASEILELCKCELEKQKEQKPAEWSEEDEAMRDNILRLLSCFVGTSECDSNPSLSTSYPAYQREIDWLKSLHPQAKQEWSEEDKAMIGCIVCCLDGQFVTEAARKQCLEWFNKHRRDFLNQPKQEWNEFDEGCLKRAIWYVENPAPSVVKDTNLVLWLKSLKDRGNFPKSNTNSPSEWSEEDENVYKWVYNLFERSNDKWFDCVFAGCYPKVRRESVLSMLKSLRPQPKKELSIEKAIKWLDDTFYFLNNSSGRGRDCEITTHDFDSLEEMYDSFRKAVIVDSEPHWKPKDEQMIALKCAIEDIAKFSKRGGRQVEFENEPYYMALHSLYEQLKKLM